MSGDRRCDRSRRRVSGSAASVTSAAAALRRTSSEFAAERLCREYRASSKAAGCENARVSAAALPRNSGNVANCTARRRGSVPQRTGELHAAVARDAERAAVACGRPAAAAAGFGVNSSAVRRRIACRRCVNRRLAPCHALRVPLRRGTAGSQAPQAARSPRDAARDSASHLAACLMSAAEQRAAPGDARRVRGSSCRF